jgi:hypothetical protein
MEAREKRVCVICHRKFTNKANLNRHTETNHKDQNTPEAVAKRQKLKDYRRNNRRDRRANDPVYREKMQQADRKYKMKVKARISACATGGVDTSINEPFIDARKPPTDTHEPPTDAHEPPTDAHEPATDTHEPATDAHESSTYAHESSTDAHESDNRQGGSSRVKKARKKDKTKGVPWRVETTALTTANIISFFTPKYDAPRSKEQRVANPRPSAI